MTDINIIKDELLLYKEKRQVLFKEQYEWYSLNRGKCLCDCVNCINSRSNRIPKPEALSHRPVSFLELNSN